MIDFQQFIYINHFPDVRKMVSRLLVKTVDYVQIILLVYIIFKDLFPLYAKNGNRLILLPDICLPNYFTGT